MLDSKRSDKLLLTSGPLTTSLSVKQATGRDLGSRDREFIGICTNIRKSILKLAGISNQNYDTILLPGSGTYGVEAVLTTVLKQSFNISVVGSQSVSYNIGDHLLICINGAYGKRMEQMCYNSKIKYSLLEAPEDSPIKSSEVLKKIQADSTITAVAIVHLETTSGILNPVEEIGQVIKKRNPYIRYIVDAMSSFGGIPLDIINSNISYLITSSDKCIQGIPGFSIIIANIDDLIRRKDNTASLSLNLYDQYMVMKNTQQFRFTPPVQSLLAFNQALKELEEEGGILARYNRYRLNQKTLVEGMINCGFSTFLTQCETIQSPIITTFYFPKVGFGFDFQFFYNYLSENGFIIYPGKMTTTDTFRIGTIGCLIPADIERFLEVVYKLLE